MNHLISLPVTLLMLLLISQNSVLLAPNFCHVHYDMNMNGMEPPMHVSIVNQPSLSVKQMFRGWEDMSP